MASKALYTAVAVVGIAAASGAAWWFQQQAAPARRPTAGSGRAGARRRRRGGAGGAAPARRRWKWPGSKSLRLTDDAQAVGSLRSRQSVMLRPEVSRPRHAAQLPRRRARAARPAAGAAGRPAAAGAGASRPRPSSRSPAPTTSATRSWWQQNFIAQRAVDESAANLQVAEAKLALAQATLARLKIVAPVRRHRRHPQHQRRRLPQGRRRHREHRGPGRALRRLPPARALPDQGAARARRALVDVDALPGPQLQRRDPGDRPAGGRQRPLDRRARLHRQPPAAAAPRHVRAHHRRCSASATTRG